jgi:glycosidase
VNLRQYSTEGTFDAFSRSLPRLKEMGVGILWFMPINPIGLAGRKNKPSDLGSYYSVRDYRAVNPEFGTLNQWKELVQDAHRMGFHVIQDWVPNHSSPDNPWITNHPSFYKLDSSGKPMTPYDWTDTRKLNYDNPELRDSMLSAMVFWVKATGIDGFRCDVAGDVPDDFWKWAIDSLRQIKPLFMLAEGNKPSLHQDGFDATYPWDVMAVAYGIASGKTRVDQLDSVIRMDYARFPADAFRMYYTTNHDENSWNGTEFERFGAGSKTFAVWAFTMGQSVPMIYSGQEEPNRKRLKFFVKDSIAWKHYSLASFYQSLCKMRLSTPALAADAEFVKLNLTRDDGAIFAYLRRKEGHRFLVVLNFSGKKQSFRLDGNLWTGKARDAFNSSNLNLDSGHQFQLAPWGWQLYNYDAP